MLTWVVIGVFGVSIGLTWYNSNRKKYERELKLRSIRKKIADNEKAKKKTNNE